MGVNIHQSAFVDPSAQLGSGVIVGPYAIIGKDVQVGDRTEVYAHSVIGSGTTIGMDCELHYGAIIGDKPQDISYKDEPTKVIIGDRTKIREYVTIHKATGPGNATVVGDDCFLMSFVHVGHNCKIGNRVVIVNQTSLAGHVEIEDFVTIGGMVGIPQFLKVGKLAMVAGYSRLFQDVPPFMLAEGNPAEVHAINAVGLKRNQFITRETASTIKQAYRLLYRENLNTTQAIEKIKLECVDKSGVLLPEIQHLIEFIKKAKKGISRSASRGDDPFQVEDADLWETTPFFEKMRQAFLTK